MAINIRVRYASAVHSTNLTVKTAKNSTEEAETYLGDPEILGAYGLADRNLERGYVEVWKNKTSTRRSFTPAPLAVPLERLFAGDHNAAHEVVRILADLAFDQAHRNDVQLSRTQAQDMAKATLAWFRHGTCQPCGGRGFPLLKDSPVQSSKECDKCEGTGKIPFERNFRYEWKPLALWLKERMEDESGRAAPHAMRALAKSMDL
jgi:hypothetical protein